MHALQGASPLEISTCLRPRARGWPFRYEVSRRMSPDSTSNPAPCAWPSCGGAWPTRTRPHSMANRTSVPAHAHMCLVQPSSMLPQRPQQLWGPQTNAMHQEFLLTLLCVLQPWLQWLPCWQRWPPSWLLPMSLPQHRQHQSLRMCPPHALPAAACCSVLVLILTAAFIAPFKVPNLHHVPLMSRAMCVSCIKLDACRSGA